MKLIRIPFVFLLLLSAACSSLYYGAMEKMGVYKRDIMVDRVTEARDSQNEAKEQFLSAMDQFKSVVDFHGGDLEKEYDKLNAVYLRTEAGAQRVRDRIAAVENVANALFREWRAEIRMYDNKDFKQISRDKYRATRDRYRDLRRAMKNAEARLEPALAPLRDQVLFLKHNLNASAIAGLSGELTNVRSNVDELIREMETAIARADAFIASLSGS